MNKVRVLAPMLIPNTISGSPVNRKMMLTPSRAMPTTSSPMTAPPLNARMKARDSPCFLAAAAVRTFALTAISIPINPANAEHRAPKTYVRPILTLIKRESRTAMIAMKIARYLYSVFKKDRDPS